MFFILIGEGVIAGSSINTMNDDLEHAMNVLHINREGVSRLV